MDNKPFDHVEMRVRAEMQQTDGPAEDMLARLKRQTIESIKPTLAKAYIIECRTGCSCCSSDNHKRGPYTSRSVAEEKVASFRAIPLLASQYARSGIYDIEECEAEVLPDGRLIINERLFAGWADTTLDDEISTSWWRS